MSQTPTSTNCSSSSSAPLNLEHRDGTCVACRTVITCPNCAGCPRRVLTCITCHGTGVHVQWCQTCIAERAVAASVKTTSGGEGT